MKASIYYNEGQLIVDYTESSLFSKHYDVTHSFDGDRIIVEGNKPNFKTIFGERVYDNLEEFSDEYIQVEKSWFRKPRKYVTGIVELKQRSNKKYTSNNYLIIQD